jgi:thiosulfate dehydrogenase [quinone] large subunit
MADTCADVRICRCADEKSEIDLRSLINFVNLLKLLPMLQKIKPIHILRFGLGIDMLMHGIVRMPDLTGFVAHSSTGFKTSFLPEALVTAFLYVLPFIEALIGLLILIGGNIGRLGFIAGGFLMAILLFGTASHQAWDLASQQVIYLMAFTFALILHDKKTAVL